MSSTATEILTLARAQSVRFWSKVQKSEGCWLWLAGKDKDGYGKFALTRARDGGPTQVHVRAHRLSIAMVLGIWPGDDVVTLHSCDVPACVNPAHLKFGTQGENRRDCVAKGRTARGETNGKAVLTEHIVRAARALFAEGKPVAAVARELRIGRTALYALKKGDSWRHVA